MKGTLALASVLFLVGCGRQAGIAPRPVIARPSNLAFLDQIDPSPTRATMWSAHGSGHHLETREYDIARFDFTLPPQAVAHLLKAKLKASDGWTLNFPDARTYGANATHYRSPTVADWKLMYIPNGPGSSANQTIEVWDETRPTRVQVSN